MAGKEEEEKSQAAGKGKEKAVDGPEPSQDAEKKDAGKDAKHQQNGIMPPGKLWACAASKRVCGM